jgi:hypothetical protein
MKFTGLVHNLKVQDFSEELSALDKNEKKNHGD